MSELRELKSKLVKMLNKHSSVKTNSARFLVPDIFKFFNKEGYIVVKPLVPKNITDRVVDGANKVVQKVRSIFRRVLGK